MPLGALATAAAGTALGNLAGQSLLGGGGADLVDAPVQGITFQRTESFLDPQQLQFILNALDNAEKIANGSIEGSLDDAVATLQQAQATISAPNQAAADANVNALNQLQASLGLGGQSGTDLQELIANTPGYQFQYDQGMKAVERSAAAKGLLESGTVMKELQRFGQGLASSSYGDYQQKLLDLANATSNQSLGYAGLNSTLARGIADAQLGAGRNLADIALQQAQQRQSAYLQGGKNTVTNQSFNIGGIKGLTVEDLLNEAPGFKGFVAPEPGAERFPYSAVPYQSSSQNYY